MTKNSGLDFSALAPQEGAHVKSTRASYLDGTPIREWYRNAMDNPDKAFTVVLHDEEAADQLKGMLRAAASEHVEMTVKTRQKFNDDGTVSLSYQAAPMKRRGPRKPKAGKKDDGPTTVTI